MAKYVFPAVYEKSEDGYNVRFPDIENCFTCGETLEEAVEMAKDVLPLMLCEMEDDSSLIPTPTDIHDIPLSSTETASYITADTDEYRQRGY